MMFNQESHLTEAQLERISSMRNNGHTVEFLNDDDFPDWVEVTPRNTSARYVGKSNVFYALIPRDGGVVTRISDYLE